MGLEDKFLDEVLESNLDSSEEFVSEEVSSPKEQCKLNYKLILLSSLLVGSVLLIGVWFLWPTSDPFLDWLNLFSEFERDSEVDKAFHLLDMGKYQNIQELMDSYAFGYEE